MEELGKDVAKYVVLVVIVAFMALVANSSALVWGPNMVFLTRPKRPLGRSIAYTVGRGVTLMLASLVITVALVKSGVGADSIADRITQMAKTPRPWLSVLVGAAIVGAAVWVYRNPPAFLSGKKPAVREDDENARIWPAFLMGISILFANILEFAWQTIVLGSVYVSVRHNLIAMGIAAIIWTVFGTATLWGPALVFVFAPGWSRERFTRITSRIPTVKPSQVAYPLGVFGVLYALFGIWQSVK